MLNPKAKPFQFSYMSSPPPYLIHTYYLPPPLPLPLPPLPPPPQPQPVIYSNPPPFEQYKSSRDEPPTCRSVWRSKGCSSTQLEGEVQASLLAADSYDFNMLEGITTIMVKNIPNKISKKVFLEVLDKHCAEENTMLRKQEDKSAYDFVYLPIDFKSELNKGFGFVNFTNACAAVRFYNSFDKLKWGKVGFPYSVKICEIKKAKYQGKEELVKHFNGSLFKCQTNEYLPTVFNPPRNGANSACSTACVVGRRIENWSKCYKYCNCWLAALIFLSVLGRSLECMFVSVVL